MKKYIFTILSILAFFSTGFAQSGTWSGNLDINGTKLPIVFHLEDNNPTLDSPAQRTKGIPIGFEKNDNGSITISIPMIGASFEGKYANNLIIGNFKQNGLSLPLTLSAGFEKPKRPQTPKPPYPYIEEEVSFTNGNAVLKGTLTLPQNYNQDTPVLLMVTGSGLQNRDEEIFEHKPFAVIADALAKEEIATLRYDDRGYGESTGDAVNCTTEDLKDDALAGINLLRQRFNKVGVLGHSEGGTIALMLAADKKADFIVSLAGMVVSGKETLLDQNRFILTEAGFPEQTINDYCQLLSQIFDGDILLSNQLESSDLPDTLQKNLQAVMQQVNTPYMQYTLTLDIRPALMSIECPVLALNGTKDTQVFYKANLDALNKGLKPNELNRIKSFEGLNHLFQHCSSGAVTEYSIIEETLSPEVLTEITNWIQSL
ncbi:MAG: alpha/beta fold hydrolase [Bacteroides sp.]|nr:alpha/beta fold hydrolase [Bacteroides sp.]